MNEQTDGWTDAQAKTPVIYSILSLLRPLHKKGRKEKKKGKKEKESKKKGGKEKKKRKKTKRKKKRKN